MSDEFDPQSPPLGWIPPEKRTVEQLDAHFKALARMPMFAVQGEVPAGPVKVMLTDYWRHPDVLADLGREFTGFGQYTGSCVGVSAGNAVCTVSCVQRVISDDPTTAFIPWWPLDYGLTRYQEGDRGQGEGAVDSVMGEVLKRGVIDIGQPGLPAFTKVGPDGMWLSKSIELQWSDGGRIDKKWIELAKQFPVGTVAPVESAQQVKLAILSACPVLYGCSKFVSRGSIKGEGANAYVRGRYDQSGGHSTCFMGYWDHPVDGPLYLYSNQWPTSTYPKDPAGAGRCCVWLPESEVDLAFSRYGANHGEAMALSNLNYLKIQPRLINWVP